MMEQWNTGILGLFCIALKNIMIHEINQFHGETIKIDPKSLDPNTEVMRF
jgi:hypothetical protein